jgi:hypothetical protein
MSFARPGYAAKVTPAKTEDTAASQVVVSFPASVALGGHRVVRLLAGSLIYAGKDSLTDSDIVLGLTLEAADAGAPARVLVSGPVTESSWSWTPDLPIFLSSAGLMTQTPIAEGFSLIVGKAVSATEIYFGIKMPIILEN